MRECFSVFLSIFGLCVLSLPLKSETKTFTLIYLIRYLILILDHSRKKLGLVVVNWIYQLYFTYFHILLCMHTYTQNTFARSFAYIDSQCSRAFKDMEMKVVFDNEIISKSFHTTQCWWWSLIPNIYIRAPVRVYNGSKVCECSTLRECESEGSNNPISIPSL